MELSSDAIPPDSAIALRYAEPACNGQNVSPDLAWRGAPEATRSYAVTCFDPDAPTGSGWWHWIAIDIPSFITSVGAGELFGPPSRRWHNDYGYPGYGGPCPPPGRTHRYIFTVHALDVPTLDVENAATSATCRSAIYAHTLASASFTATFSRPEHKGRASRA